MKRYLLGLMGILLFATLACGLSDQATPPPPLDVNKLSTIVVATFRAMTPASIAPTQVPPGEAQPTPVPQSNGITVNFNNLSFMIPNGLAIGIAGETVPAVTADNGAPWEVGPAYIKVTLSSYPLQGTMWQPEIRIYPADEYRLINPIAGQRLDEIKSITANPNGSQPANLPFLPFINAAQDFHAQMQVVNFQNGSGIRYITQFDQAPIPVNNQEMFYTFQGLSQDGKYFISATLPVNLAFLPADNSLNSPTPADGIPMVWNNFENFPTYLTAITQKISTTDPNAFNPTLTTLDALIQSIKITVP
jgi:hypothetical protein